jgi:hypothetical protein
MTKQINYHKDSCIIFLHQQNSIDIHRTLLKKYFYILTWRFNIYHSKQKNDCREHIKFSFIT